MSINTLASSVKNHILPEVTTLQSLDCYVNVSLKNGKQNKFGMRKVFTSEGRGWLSMLDVDA